MRAHESTGPTPLAVGRPTSAAGSQRFQAPPSGGKLVVRRQGIEVLSLDLDRHWARMDLGLGGPADEPGLPLPELPLRRVVALASMLQRHGWTLEMSRHARQLVTLGRGAPAWSGHVGLHLRGVVEWLHPPAPKAHPPSGP